MASQPGYQGGGLPTEVLLIVGKSFRKAIQGRADENSQEQANAQDDYKDQQNGERFGYMLSLHPQEKGGADCGDEQRQEERHQNRAGRAHSGDHNDKAGRSNEKVGPLSDFCFLFHQISPWRYSGGGEGIGRLAKLTRSELFVQ